MMPIKAITLRSMWNSVSARIAPTPADGSVDRIVIGMDVALVQHAEHDVHGHNGRQNQPAFIGQRRLEGARRPLKCQLDAGRQAQIGARLLNGLHRIAQRCVFAQIERDGHRRELSLVIDGQRPVVVSQCAMALSGTCDAVAAKERWS
jgi:hypothetical protein